MVNVSGRYNEALRLKERYLPFNVIGLQEVASKAVNKTSKDVAVFRKLAEGGFSRTFVITMKYGMEIIARLPYPVAFPSSLAVTSEVATLRLVKLYGVPVPNVLDYSTTKENPAGAEYITMYKAQGHELGDRWFSLPDLDRAKIIGRLSKIEQNLFSIPLPASGSIFYRKDLAPQFQLKSSLELNSVSGCLLSMHAQPRFPAREYREFSNYQKSDPAEHIESLQKYLKIAPYLLPTSAEDQYLLKPTLRHPDLNPRNIFVDSGLQISSLTDWQHCSTAPLFLQAGVPGDFANFGDEDSVQLKKPERCQETHHF